MFSSRLRSNLGRNQLSLAVDRMRQEGCEVLDLTVSNPTAADLEYSASEILSAMTDPRSLRYEPDPRGIEPARLAVSRYYGPAVTPERVVLTAGTSEAYAYLLKLLCDAGDEILIPRPSYPLFDFLADLESVGTRYYRLLYDHGWIIDLDSVLQAITPRTRAIVVVNPNNPTGSFLKTDEYAGLAAICESNRLALISDEVFADFALETDARRVSTLTGKADVLTFCLSGLSKIAALPQMKLGWIVTDGPADQKREALERLELISDTFLTVNTAVQWAAPRLFDSAESVRSQIRRRTRANLDFVNGRLKATALKPLHVEAGWNVIIQAPRLRSEEEWALELLTRRHVLIQPGYFYDFESEAFIVLSLLSREEAFRSGVERLAGYSEARF